MGGRKGVKQKGRKGGKCEGKMMANVRGWKDRKCEREKMVRNMREKRRKMGGNMGVKHEGE